MFGGRSDTRLRQIKLDWVGASEVVSFLHRNELKSSICKVTKPKGMATKLGHVSVENRFIYRDAQREGETG